MYKHRRITIPVIPDTILQFVEEVQEYSETFLQVHGELFFSGVVGEGDEIAAIFFPPQLKNILVCSDEWHMDATYKTVPNKPKLRQLFTIMAIYNDQVGVFTTYQIILLN